MYRETQDVSSMEQPEETSFGSQGACLQAGLLVDRASPLVLVIMPCQCKVHLHTAAKW